MASSPRFLICRLSAVGDLIRTMPIACALRDHFPNATIAWATHPECAQLLRNHECIDQVVVTERRWFTSPRKILRLRRELRAMEFDAAIDVQSLSKSALVAWISGARKRIGFARYLGRELAPVLDNIHVERTAPHVVDAFLELLRPLGIENPKVRFGVPKNDGASQHIDTFLTGIDVSEPFAVLNPGASWESKRWPLENFAAVARHLGLNHSMQSVIAWGNEQEKGWVESIVAASPQHAVMAPPTSLVELAALLRRSSLFVGSDSGPMHLASAVGTSCISMHGPTLPEECGPYGSGHIALQKLFQTNDSKHRRRSSNKAMRAITVEDVCDACDKIIVAKRSQTAAA